MKYCEICNTGHECKENPRCVKFVWEMGLLWMHIHNISDYENECKMPIPITNRYIKKFRSINYALTWVPFSKDIYDMNLFHVEHVADITVKLLDENSVQILLTFRSDIYGKNEKKVFHTVKSKEKFIESLDNLEKFANGETEEREFTFLEFKE